MNWAVIVWFALMVFFLLAEAATVTMVSTWFAAGSLAAMIVGLLHGDVWLQVTVFLVVSAGLLLLLRPVVRKYFTPKLARTNVDSILGATGVVTQVIQNDLAAGQVKLGAMQWSARSTDQTEIPAGTLVKVDRIEGVKVFVTPVKETIEV